MKIVWVVNVPIGPLAEKLNMSFTSGLWLNASLEEVKGEGLDLYVICTCGGGKDIYIQEDGVNYIGLSMGTPAVYRHTEANLNKWKKVFSDINPDILQIWGTEYVHSLSAIMAKPEKCKALVYIQGVMTSVYDNYYGGLNKKLLVLNTSLRELVMGKSIFSARKKIKKSADNEAKVISMADGVVLETEWSKSYCRLIYNCEKFYYHTLSINKAFAEVERIPEKVEKHTIFAPASDYPLKGGHQLIKALWYVKKKYPDVKLYIPGFKLERSAGLKQKLKTKCYRRYLKKLITGLDLWDNLVFTGPLNAEEMADRMKKANVFVCCSAIENHSSTMREAMRVGVPCVCSCVGGIPEMLKNGYNGELYDFNDVTVLAGRIIKLFDDDKYANMLADNAKKTVCEYYECHQNALKDIYISLDCNK